VTDARLDQVVILSMISEQTLFHVCRDENRCTFFRIML